MNICKSSTYTTDKKKQTKSIKINKQRKRYSKKQTKKQHDSIKHTKLSLKKYISIDLSHNGIKEREKLFKQRLKFHKVKKTNKYDRRQEIQNNGVSSDSDSISSSDDAKPQIYSESNSKFQETTDCCELEDVIWVYPRGLFGSITKIMVADWKMLAELVTCDGDCNDETLHEIQEIASTTRGLLDLNSYTSDSDDDEDCNILQERPLLKEMLRRAYKRNSNLLCVNTVPRQHWNLLKANLKEEYKPHKVTETQGIDNHEMPISESQVKERETNYCIIC